LLVFAVSLAVTAAVTGQARAAGPTGWEHFNDAQPLNGAVRAWSLGTPGTAYAGGSFTDAGGNPNVDHVQIYHDRLASNPPGPPGPLNGDVFALAYADGRLFAGGTFTDAGGNANADYLAVWDGIQWQPVCEANGPPLGGGVDALQIIGSTLYVGGTFQNGAGIAAADYLLACDLTTGVARATVAADGQSNGAVYALAADSNGRLYAGGTFSDMAGIPAADYVASYDGSTWQALGSGTGSGGGAVTGIVRSLGASGTNVFVGTDASDVAGIPQADHVARWNGSAWSAVGANSAGTDGWFPAATSIDAIATDGRVVFAGGSFQNAGGNPLADEIAAFNGSSWGPVGSNGSGDGPLNGSVLALTVLDGYLLAGGNFTAAGGDPAAAFGADFVPPPRPTEGKTVNAVPESGTVLVKLPGSSVFVSLASLGGQIPVGSTLDATHGVVRLASATNSAGATQTGLFSLGQFRVGQRRKNPLTTVSMTGGGLNACSKLPHGGALKRRRARSLFSNVHGRFRTRGRNSTATVRGTEYLVKDTCAGTLTKVKKGRVVVRDLRLGRTRTVKAGHSYFARAPKR
jgi:hypothetical protein